MSTEVKVKYVPAVKGGRAWNGFHSDRGQVVHAVPEQIYGGFWGGYSLCNTRPGDRSYGWSDTKKEINCPKCLKKTSLMQGWTNPTLHHVENQWRIYSDSGVAFVPLEKASAALVAACPGAGEKLEELDSEPF